MTRRLAAWTAGPFLVATAQGAGLLDAIGFAVSFLLLLGILRLTWWLLRHPRLDEALAGHLPPPLPDERTRLR